MTEFTEAAVRADVRKWLEANWSVDRGLVEWRNMLISSGWGVPTWPKDWFGMDLPAALAPVVEEEFSARSVSLRRASGVWRRRLC